MIKKELSIEELFDKVVLIQKVETGLAQSVKGQSESTEQAKLKLKKWLKNPK